MNTAQTHRTWHYDMNLFGDVYPLRYYTDDFGRLSGAQAVTNIINLPDRLAPYERAIHEAGHAVAALTHGIHPKYIDGAHTNLGPLSAFSADALVCCFGAGERAVDRWLHNRDLWTPLRAAAVECSAYADRATLRKYLIINDYLEVHDFADEFLTRNWPAVTAVAEALVTSPALTGEQIASIVQNLRLTA